MAQDGTSFAGEAVANETAERVAAGFDADGWMRDLAALNPWAQGTFDTQEAFDQARLQAGLARWRAGVETWNAWAEPMLALKARLEAAGLWLVDGHPQVGREQQAYEACATSNFSELCFPGGVIFSGFVFPSKADFSEAFFGDKQLSAGDARFENAAFSGGAWFNRATFSGGHALFNHAMFNGPADFIFATFSSTARFGGAAFEMGAAFADAAFRDDARFALTSFDGAADFGRAAFNGAALFIYTKFNGADAEFDNTTFSHTANMTGTQFLRRADFTQARFDGQALFTDTFFYGSALFKSARSTSGFDLTNARFRQVPDFIQADFQQAPRLDNIDIADPMSRPESSDGDPRPKSWLWRATPGTGRFKVAPDSDDEAKYRVLRKMAIEAHDHERELEFHAQEIRCRRFWRDRPWGRHVYEVVEADADGETQLRRVSRAEFDAFEVGTEARGDPAKPEKVTLRRLDKRVVPAGSGKFWFGWAYGGVSDFGRSLIRPALTWTVFLLLFAALFLALAGPVQPSRQAKFAVIPQPLYDCPVGAKHCPWVEATVRRARDAVAPLWTSFAGKSCVAGTGSSPVAEAAWLSLRNSLIFIQWDRAAAARRTYGCLYGFENGSVRFPRVPFMVSLLSMAQSFLSAILIFLFGLALRNLLKLR